MQFPLAPPPPPEPQKGPESEPKIASAVQREPPITDTMGGEEEKTRDSDNQADDSIRVICRFRPLNKSEEAAGSKFICSFPSNRGQEDQMVSIGVSPVLMPCCWAAGGAGGLLAGLGVFLELFRCLGGVVFTRG